MVGAHCTQLMKLTREECTGVCLHSCHSLCSSALHSDKVCNPVTNLLTKYYYSTQLILIYCNHIIKQPYCVAASYTPCNKGLHATYHNSIPGSPKVCLNTALRSITHDDLYKGHNYLLRSINQQVNYAKTPKIYLKLFANIFTWNTVTYINGY